MPSRDGPCASAVEFLDNEGAHDSVSTTGSLPAVIFSTIPHTRIGPDHNRFVQLQAAKSAALAVITGPRKIVSSFQGASGA